MISMLLLIVKSMLLLWPYLEPFLLPVPWLIAG